eukprot:6505690-Prymnesium_polylepis.1
MLLCVTAVASWSPTCAARGGTTNLRAVSLRAPLTCSLLDDSDGETALGKFVGPARSTSGIALAQLLEETRSLAAEGVSRAVALQEAVAAEAKQAMAEAAFRERSARAKKERMEAEASRAEAAKALYSTDAAISLMER